MPGGKQNTSVFTEQKEVQHPEQTLQPQSINIRKYFHTGSTILSSIGIIELHYRARGKTFLNLHSQYTSWYLAECLAQVRLLVVTQVPVPVTETVSQVVASAVVLESILCLIQIALVSVWAYCLTFLFIQSRWKETYLIWAIGVAIAVTICTSRIAWNALPEVLLGTANVSITACLLADYFWSRYIY